MKQALQISNQINHKMTSKKGLTRFYILIGFVKSMLELLNYFDNPFLSFEILVSSKYPQHLV